MQIGPGTRAPNKQENALRTAVAPTVESAAVFTPP